MKEVDNNLSREEHNYIDPARLNYYVVLTAQKCMEKKIKPEWILIGDLGPLEQVAVDNGINALQCIHEIRTCMDTIRKLTKSIIGVLSGEITDKSLIRGVHNAIKQAGIEMPTPEKDGVGEELVENPSPVVREEVAFLMDSEEFEGSDTDTFETIPEEATR
jgi:hypothetical protein